MLVLVKFHDGEKNENDFSIFLVIRKPWSIHPIWFGIASLHPNWCHPFGENYTTNLIWFQHVSICFFLYFQQKSRTFICFGLTCQTFFHPERTTLWTQVHRGRTRARQISSWKLGGRSSAGHEFRFFRSELGQNFLEILEEFGFKKTDSPSHSP